MVQPTKTSKKGGPESAAGHNASAAGLKRRWLLNAGLLIIIALLAGVVMHRSGQEKIAVGQPLTALATDVISHIRLERPDQATVALEKTGDKWKLTAPLAARANRFNVEKLLRLLSAPSEIRFPAVATELAKFGLDKPQTRVWYENEPIAFGAMHPLNNQIYVQYNNEVVLIPAHHLAAATYLYTNFIDGHLFEEERMLTALRLPDFTLALRNGVWHRQPADKKLTSDQINEFAAAWKNASALSVDKYSGKAVVANIEVASAPDNKGNKLRLGILAYQPDFILLRQDENLEYHFTAETGKRLLQLSGEP